MELTLKRLYKNPKYSIGKLFINGKYFCDTLEDTDRGLKDSMTEAGIKMLKIKGQTAIPLGIYQVLWTYSVRFRKYMPLVNNVKGFTGIRIHSGNTASDTEGCILLGNNKAIGKVINSKVTCEKFYKLFKSAIDKQEKITLKIE